jgi:hypothetical protein
VYNILGKGNRIALPSCALAIIRNQFPSIEDTYKGFVEARDDE